MPHAKRRESRDCASICSLDFLKCVRSEEIFDSFLVIGFQFLEDNLAELPLKIIFILIISNLETSKFTKLSVSSKAFVTLIYLITERLAAKSLSLEASLGTRYSSVSR